MIGRILASSLKAVRPSPFHTFQASGHPGRAEVSTQKDASRPDVRKILTSQRTFAVWRTRDYSAASAMVNRSLWEWGQRSRRLAREQFECE